MDRLLPQLGVGTPGTAAPPCPLYIGPRNAEAVTGQRWRWCRDHARKWGIPVFRIDAKPLIPADQFRAALEAHAQRPEAPMDDVTELEAMRRRLGKRRRTVDPKPNAAIAEESASDGARLPHEMPQEPVW